MPARTADLAERFAELERVVEAQPEGVVAEIAVGVFHMTPRPNPRRAFVQAALAGILSRRYGRDGDRSWQFFEEVEIRSEEAASRLIPDVSGWDRRRGFIDLDQNPVTVAPVWVAEILSPTTEHFDRSEKLPAYALMGVSWVWFVDVKKRRIEVYENVGGRMAHRETRGAGERLDARPFEELDEKIAELFAV